MYPANITRDEAAQRSAMIATHSYQVTVDLSGRVPDAEPYDAEEAFVSTSTVRFTSRGGRTSSTQGVPLQETGGPAPVIKCNCSTRSDRTYGRPSHRGVD